MKTAVTDRKQTPAAGPPTGREQMNVVVIGHVDHGKSTLIGRLLADTGSLPEGKLEAVRENCRRSARPFEYAFLLDALKDEQAQGITIDSARCFFKSGKREYIVIDAPGHIEFLKNMVSGAARAEAGLLVIDAHEGVQENSRRHGYLMAMLGIRQVAVCINKMDLVDYDRDTFERIRDEYTRFLEQVGLQPQAVIPVSAREGDNLVKPSPNTPWYGGEAVLAVMDGFAKEPPPVDKPLRMPVQDVYKFTAEGDDRRIVAGRVETGSVRRGDEVVFWPSGKRSRVAGLEAFNAPEQVQAEAGRSTGVTLTEQVFVKPGELMCRAGDPAPTVSTRLRVNLFWMSPNPMVPERRYKLKLASSRSAVWLTDIAHVLDAASLEASDARRQIERHDVAECTLETLRPVACDLAADIPQTGRFVIIDNYEIAGGGVIMEADPATDTLVQQRVKRRDEAWDRSSITPAARAGRFGQRPALVLITGARGAGKKALARRLEEHLFGAGRLVYYLGLADPLLGASAEAAEGPRREEFLNRLGEVSHLFTDAGAIFIAAVSDLDDHELEMIETLNRPGELVTVNLGPNRFVKRRPDLTLDGPQQIDRALERIGELLKSKNYILEYYL